MEPNIKPAASAVANATDSSLGSLETSFGQLTVTPINIISTSSGSINRLPNEMLKHILVKLYYTTYNKCDHTYRHYYDVSQLLLLRLLSTRWRATVEDFCREKGTLLINCERTDLTNCVPLVVKLNSKSSVHFFAIIPKLFPSIVQLQIETHRSLDDCEFGHIALAFNQLSCLKRLELGNGLEKTLPLLSQTLNQLEYIAVTAYNGLTLTKEKMLQFLVNLGPNCSLVYLKEEINLNYNQILQWHSAKPTFFANLTHLEIGNETDECDQIVHFLGLHATSLKLLKFPARAPPFELTAAAIRDLSRLTSLAELELWNISMDLSDLEDAAAEHQLRSLPSVLVGELYVTSLEWTLTTNEDQLMRILSIIFPNLSDLKLWLELVMETRTQEAPEEQAFVPYLSRFSNLRKHFIHINKSVKTIAANRGLE